jgi:hypothetical protein
MRSLSRLSPYDCRKVYNFCMSIFKRNNTLTVKTTTTAMQHIARVAAGLPTYVEPKKQEVTKSGKKVGR